MSRRRGRIPDLQPQETDTYSLAREQLLTVADAWPVLEELVAAGSTPGSGTAKPASRVPIDAEVADVRTKLTLGIRFLARVLMDEVVVERHVVTPWADAGTHAEPWAPPTTDTGELARYIAVEHIGHFLHHPDQHLRVEFMADFKKLAALASATAWPSGARRLRTGIECIEHGTSDMGERVVCEGEYRVLMLPGQEVIPDMVCDVDPGHRITPLQWQRAQRRRPMNPQAAARLARTLRLARVG